MSSGSSATRLASFALTVCSGGAVAQTAFVVNDDDQLYRLDLGTLETELVGQIGVEFVYDIAALADGSIAGLHDGGPGYFLIDSVDAGLLGQGPSSSSDGFIGAIDAFGDRLFSYRNGSFREIDPLTGERTTLATLAIPTDAEKIAMINETEAFVFGSGDLGRAELYRLNFDTGAVDVLSSVLDFSFRILTLDYVDGVLYTIDADGTISVIDQNDGSFTDFGQISVGEVNAFSIVPGPGTATCIGLAGLGALRRRR